jgi:hypothetical protein
VKSQDLCSVAHCRKPASIVSLGISYCDGHDGERIDRAYAEAVKRLTQGSNTADAIDKQLNGRRGR